MKQVVLDDVLLILKTHIKDTEISSKNLTDNLSDLGMDSIAFIKIVVDLEEVFECEIPDSKIMISEMNTVKKILDVLQTMYEELMI